jgi:hypothetical protein
MYGTTDPTINPKAAQVKETPLPPSTTMPSGVVEAGRSTSRPLIDRALLTAVVQSAAARSRQTQLRYARRVENNNVRDPLIMPLDEGP